MNRSRGYPAFCRWMASDHDFFVLRRFAETSVRVALLMQDQISELEEKLAQEDERCKLAREEHAHSGTFREEPRLMRKKLLEELMDKLERYRKSRSIGSLK